MLLFLLFFLQLRLFFKFLVLGFHFFLFLSQFWVKRLACISSVTCHAIANDLAFRSCFHFSDDIPSRPTCVLLSRKWSHAIPIPRIVPDKIWTCLRLLIIFLMSHFNKFHVFIGIMIWIFGYLAFRLALPKPKESFLPFLFLWNVQILFRHCSLSSSLFSFTFYFITWTSNCRFSSPYCLWTTYPYLPGFLFKNLVITRRRTSC